MNYANRRARVVLGIAIVLIAGLHAAYYCLPLPSGDGGTYLLLARKLLAGEYFFSASRDTFPLLYRTPGYPLFLALLALLPGNTLKNIVLAQHLLGLLSALAIYKTGLAVWNRRLPAAAGAVFAGLHFHFLYLASYPLSETLAVFFSCALLCLAVTLSDNEKAGLAGFAFCGLAAACAGLCRPELFGLGLLCAVFIYSGGNARAGLRPGRAAVFLLPVLLFAGAWGLRNGLLFDYPGLTPNSQAAFFDGPAGRVIRAGQAAPDIVNTPAMESRGADGGVNRAVFFLVGFGVPYQWSARRIGALALQAALADPPAYFRASFGQLYKTLFAGSAWPPSGITESMPDLFTAASPRTGFAGFLSGLGKIDGWLESVFLAPLFLAGCALALYSRRSKSGLLLAAAPLYLLAAYAFLSPMNLRYRVVAEPFMGLLAANAAYRACLLLAGRGRDYLQDKPGKFMPAWLSGGAPALVLAAAFLAWGLFMAGLCRAYDRRVHFTEAEPLLGALARDPADNTALVRLGQLSNERGLYLAALRYFDRALLRAPADKAAAGGRAEALFKMGRGGEALDELSRLLVAHPGASDVLYNIALINYLSGDSGKAVENFSKVLGTPSVPEGIRRHAFDVRAELLLKAGWKSKAGKTRRVPGLLDKAIGKMRKQI